MDDNNVIIELKKVLDEIRPAIQSDGGDIELISYDSGIVSLKFSGACVGCPMSFYTLKYFIEDKIRERIPAVSDVISID